MSMRRLTRLTNGFNRGTGGTRAVGLRQQQL
jgi:hypothetical protein